MITSMADLFKGLILGIVIGAGAIAYATYAGYLGFLL